MFLTIRNLKFLIVFNILIVRYINLENDIIDIKMSLVKSYTNGTFIIANKLVVMDTIFSFSIYIGQIKKAHVQT